MIEASASESELRKRSLVTQLISTDDILISTQVINETCSVLSRKAAFEESQLKQIIQELYDGCIVIEMNLDILLYASDLRLRYDFSFWDGLIVASALSAKAEILYSEDMQDGLVVEQRLTIVNPFK